MIGALNRPNRRSVQIVRAQFAQTGFFVRPLASHASRSRCESAPCRVPALPGIPESFKHLRPRGKWKESAIHVRHQFGSPQAAIRASVGPRAAPAVDSRAGAAETKRQFLPRAPAAAMQLPRRRTYFVWASFVLSPAASGLPTHGGRGRSRRIGGPHGGCRDQEARPHLIGERRRRRSFFSAGRAAGGDVELEQGRNQHRRGRKTEREGDDQEHGQRVAQ